MIKICITSYPPFTFYVPEDLLPEPIVYEDLKGALPTTHTGMNTMFLNDTSLKGYDIDFIRLIFERMLGEAAGWTVQFETFNSFTMMWMGVLGGTCDVAITASQARIMTRQRAHGCARNTLTRYAPLLFYTRIDGPDT